MNDDAFARLVAEEIKNKASQQQRDYLNLPENWARWQRAVQYLADNLEAQVRAIHATEQDELARYTAIGAENSTMVTELMADFETRRKKIERFRFHVTNRVDDITRMIAMGTDAVEDRLKTVDFLRKAIETHKSMMFEYELEPTPIDIALWAALEDKWKFDDLDEDEILEFGN